PTGKLPERVIADFETWIKQGAVDPRGASSARQFSFDVGDAGQFWAFQRPQRHAPPLVRAVDWPRRTMDRFILARLETAGMKPSPPADRRTSLRRLSFDVIGLPPTPEEIDSFLCDSSPDAGARVVERLLASPHYGERWARVWLDVARYAEDQ